MNFYFCLLDREEKIVFTNLPDNLKKSCFNCNVLTEIISINNIKYRRGMLSKKEVGKVFLLTNCINHINSSRIFKEKLKIYLEFLDNIKDIKDEIVNSILHDITKINGYCLQELYSLIPEDAVRQKSYKKQILALEKHIVQNKNNVAKGLFRVNRDVTRLKTECSNLKSLFSKSFKTDKKLHNIGKAIRPSLHVYIPLLSEKGVEVRFSDENAIDIEINFEYFDSALSPFFDNLVKYILPNSELTINFLETSEDFIINFDMVSMAIKGDEVDKIYENGYSGINAIKNKINGKGIGLGRIKDSLLINNAELRIKNNVNNRVEKRFRETNYERNVFQIVFFKNANY